MAKVAELTTPLYRKNIRQWEQWTRVAAGVGLLVAAVVVSSTLGRVVFAANGVFMVVTGFVGWCPACATFGRRVPAGPGGDDRGRA